MTTYKIVTVANEWNRFGDRINVRDIAVIETNDPVLAGKAYSEQNTKLWGAKHAQHIEVRDAFGNVVEHSELYAAVIGPELFAAQLADDNFSINLDDFFNGL